MLRPRFTFQYSPISIAQYDFLKELPLYQFYEKFKNISTVENGNHTECDNLTDNKELQKICNMLGDILDIIEDISILVDAGNNNRSCKYLNYLVQEEIEKGQYVSDTLTPLYEALNKYKSSYGNYKCDFVQNTNTDNNIAQTINKLNYYAEYLIWIKEKFGNIQNTRKNECLLFLNECVLYYDRLLLHDTCNESKKYETALRDFKVKYNEALTAIKFKYPDINLRTMQDDVEYKEYCSTDQEESHNGNEEGFPLDLTITFNSRTSPLPLPAIHSNLGDNHQESIPEDSHGLTLVKATPYIGSTVAIFIFLFVLHKFTPFGTFLRNNIKIDRNRMKEKQDHKYKLLSKESNIPHNIAYEPIGYK